jgi:hypothetical protein
LRSSCAFVCGAPCGCAAEFVVVMAKDPYQR